MIRSMTGYARVESKGDWGRLVWELRSVNHRYLDVSFKAPEEFRAIESELRQTAGKAVSRGKLEAGLRYFRDTGAVSKIEPDMDRVKDIGQAINAISQHMDGLAAVDPLRLLNFPGVLIEESADTASLLAATRELFTEALKQFNENRAAEGARLETFMLERCDSLAVLVEQVRKRYAEVKGSNVERLRARAAELNVELDEGRLEQEMVIALQKLDVEEEMSRLASHLTEVRDALKRSESVGRRLDFLMQELNRESNTLSSKSQDAELTRCAVEMKVLVEQIREQVQNVE